MTDGFTENTLGVALGASVVRTLTRVVNVSLDPFDIYVGRSMPRRRFRDAHVPPNWHHDHVGLVAESPLGNPFKIGQRTPQMDRSEAIGRYWEWLIERPELMALVPALQGKRIGCWCAPRGGLFGHDYPFVCHGQILAALADGLPILLDRLEDTDPTSG